LFKLDVVSIGVTGIFDVVFISSEDVKGVSFILDSSCAKVFGE
jgi:hypothetical protein